MRSSAIASADLTQVLGQASLDGVTDNIVDELSLSLGAVASTAEANGSEDATSEYTVADGVMTLSSPAVGGLSDSLNKVVDGAGGTLEDVIAKEGLADKLANAGIDLNAGVADLKLGGEGTTVDIEGQDALNSVVENLVNEKLEDDAGIVSIDLKNGDIKIDLAKVVKGENGEDLNGLDPNTQVLTSETIGKITDAVADALGALSGKFNETLKDGLNAAHAKISLPAKGSLAGIPADGKINIDATLGQLAGTGEGDPEITTDLKVAGIDLGSLINTITDPLLKGLLGVTQPLIGGLVNSTADQVTGAVTDAVDPILSGLDPVFEGLNKIVDLTINEQPTKRDPAEDSNVKGADEDGFTVNAVSLELLPDGIPGAQSAPQAVAPHAAGALADINLASSSVRATAADEAPGDDADADDSATADADDSASADADDAAAATADADDSATADADDSAAANDEANASADADDAASATNDANASATADADDSAAANEEANADDSAEATDDANAAADNNDDANASANASTSANADNDANASASAAADGGDLPRTGANGTLALGGLAALLVAGGGIAIYLTRRNRSGL